MDDHFTKLHMEASSPLATQDETQHLHGKGVARFGRPRSERVLSEPSIGAYLYERYLFDILTEENFLKMLQLERKRTKRSGELFLLMLFDAKGIEDGAKREEALRAIRSLRHYALRDTDIMGWYRKDHVLGVIFTEIKQAFLDKSMESIYYKIDESIKHLLPRDQVDKIRIAFSSADPGEIEESKNGSSASFRLQYVSNSDIIEENTFGKINCFLWGMLRNAWFLLFVDIILIAFAYMISTMINIDHSVYSFKHRFEAYTFAVVLTPIVFYIVGIYNIKKNFDFREIVFRMLMAQLIITGVSTSFFYFTPQWQHDRAAFGTWMALSALLLTGWRVSYGTVVPRNPSRISTLVVGAGESGKAACRLLCAPFSPYEVKGFVDDVVSDTQYAGELPAVLGNLEQIWEAALKTGSKAAVLAIPHNRSLRVMRSILKARLRGIEILELSEVYEQLARRIPVEFIEDQWFLVSRGFHLLSKEYIRKFKRVMDILVSWIILTLALPVMVLTALAIGIESSGPIFYAQTRVGKGSKLFKVHKFRSMRVDAEAMGVKWAQKNDTRVTRVGRLIRFSRIDELPQLWNVFKGDMSLVGPRPERPEFVKDLEEQIPYYSMRHLVQPGITGWAQIHYPYGASVEDAMRKLEYELYYIKNMSILLDLKIILRTVGVVLLGEGAR